MPNNIISTAGLSRRYGRRIGVDGIDLEVREGELFGFLGPNGAGKTTLIRLLMGFIAPDQGTASIAGLDCWRRTAEIKKLVGYLPGDLRLYPWFTAANALDIVSKVRGVDVRPAGRELADRLGLEFDLRVQRMSRGTRQKLGLVLTMAHQPRLLVLDEPTSGLDPIVQQVLANHLRDLAAAGHTIFFSSHTLSEVENLCDRVAIIRRGRLVADESLNSLRSRAARSVELVFATELAAQTLVPPALLRVVSRSQRTVTCELQGPVAPLLAWAAESTSLSDVSIGKPDLERLFHGYFSPEEAIA